MKNHVYLHQVVVNGGTLYVEDGDRLTLALVAKDGLKTVHIQVVGEEIRITEKPVANTSSSFIKS